MCVPLGLCSFQSAGSPMTTFRYPFVLGVSHHRNSPGKEGSQLTLLLPIENAKSGFKIGAFKVYPLATSVVVAIKGSSKISMWLRVGVHVGPER